MTDVILLYMSSVHIFAYSSFTGVLNKLSVKRITLSTYITVFLYVFVVQIWQQYVSTDCY
jgi:hypothetical protein